MYHAARKGEFQQFNRSYSTADVFHFFVKSFKFSDVRTVYKNHAEPRRLEKYPNQIYLFIGIFVALVSSVT